MPWCSNDLNLAYILPWTEVDCAQIVREDTYLALKCSALYFTIHVATQSRVLWAKVICTYSECTNRIKFLKITINMSNLHIYLWRGVARTEPHQQYFARCRNKNGLTVSINKGVFTVFYAIRNSRPLNNQYWRSNLNIWFF